MVAWRLVAVADSVGFSLFFVPHFFAEFSLGMNRTTHSADFGEFCGPLEIQLVFIIF